MVLKTQNYNVGVNTANASVVVTQQYTKNVCVFAGLKQAHSLRSVDS